MYSSICLMVLFMVLSFGQYHAQAYSLYLDRIPNGYNVKDPQNPSRSWPAVGHVTAYGGEFNPFGDDFDDQGRRWTVELCRMDSDGDGATNGEELGDPDCVWKPGQTPKFSSPITHPGMPGDRQPKQQQQQLRTIPINVAEA